MPPASAACEQREREARLAGAGRPADQHRAGADQHRGGVDGRSARAHHIAGRRTTKRAPSTVRLAVRIGRADAVLGPDACRHAPR